MIDQQIEIFTRSLTHLATQYSDPSIILQHIPVLKDNLMFQQNPEYIFYGAGAIVAALFMLRMLKKRRKKMEKNIAMVMPQPYLGDADHTNTDETAPASFEKDSFGENADLPALAPQTGLATQERSGAQQLEDVSAVRFAAQAALSPNEARARVMVQAALSEFGAGYMIMARTALTAILHPADDAFGIERAQGIRAIEDKYLDFGVFDRAGRCLVAIEVNGDTAPIGSKAIEKSIVRTAMTQANIPVATLHASDRPIDIHAKLAPYLKATTQTASLPAPSQVKRIARPGRPTRPVRPVAIAAE